MLWIETPLRPNQPPDVNYSCIVITLLTASLVAGRQQVEEMCWHWHGIPWPPEFGQEKTETCIFLVLWKCGWMLTRKCSFILRKYVYLFVNWFVSMLVGCSWHMFMWSWHWVTWFDNPKTETFYNNGIFHMTILRKDFHGWLYSKDFIYKWNLYLLVDR